MDKDHLTEIISKRPFVLFGASQAAINFLRYYPNVVVDCFWDNSKEKNGTLFENKKILLPKEKKYYEQKVPFILITSMYDKEISSQLETLGYLKNIDFVTMAGFNRLFGKLQFFPPGHFYSPIPDVLEIQENEYLNNLPKSLNGVDLKIEHQINLLSNFKDLLVSFKNDYQSLKFERFRLNNGYFGEFDGSILYSMILTKKPKKIIEVGSGFSSALMLDIKKAYQLDDLELTFIEPFPERLESLLEKDDYEQVLIYKEKVQFIDFKVFSSLMEGDILFIDSSHVSKIGSDVNYIIFEILPKLKPGVMIHFHDIFYPFEYPEKWIFEGRFWNEAYLLRAFLQYNQHFEIDLWNNYLISEHKETFGDRFEGKYGSSIWLQKK